MNFIINYNERKADQIYGIHDKQPLMSDSNDYIEADNPPANIMNMINYIECFTC